MTAHVDVQEKNVEMISPSLSTNRDFATRFNFISFTPLMEDVHVTINVTWIGWGFLKIIITLRQALELRCGIETKKFDDRAWWRPSVKKWGMHDRGLVHKRSLTWLSLCKRNIHLAGVEVLIIQSRRRRQAVRYSASQCCDVVTFYFFVFNAISNCNFLTVSSFFAILRSSAVTCSFWTCSWKGRDSGS